MPIECRECLNKLIQKHTPNKLQIDYTEVCGQIMSPAISTNKGCYRKALSHYSTLIYTLGVIQDGEKWDPGSR